MEYKHKTNITRLTVNTCFTSKRHALWESLVYKRMWKRAAISKQRALTAGNPEAEPKGTKTRR